MSVTCKAVNHLHYTYHSHFVSQLQFATVGAQMLPEVLNVLLASSSVTLPQRCRRRLLYMVFLLCITTA